MTAFECRPAETWLNNRDLGDWKKQFDQDGYLIFENVLEQQQIELLRAALQPYLDENITGRNDFEGVKSNRVYAMLAKSPVFAALVIHPLALAFAEADLGKNCLLSACLAINLQPGESVQPWHHDDQHIAIPRPRPSGGVSVFWSIDETNEENGATEILPGSHLWPEQSLEGSLGAQHFKQALSPDQAADPGFRPDIFKATMPAGSLMIAKGTLWHRGGANKSKKPRLIITPQYCAGWARSLENQMLAVPKEIAEELPARVQELIGYSIYPPFMGYVDGMHPSKLLRRANQGN